MAATMLAKRVFTIAKISCCVTRFRISDMVFQHKRTYSLLPIKILSNKSTTKLIDNTVNKRTFSSTNINKNEMNDIDVKKGMEQLTDKFTEARELIEDARESLGTVYFSEDMSDAQEAVKETLEEYNELLSQLSDSQRTEVMRTIGLRMEELKAQQAALEESLKD